MSNDLKEWFLELLRATLGLIQWKLCKIKLLIIKMRF